MHGDIIPFCQGSLSKFSTSLIKKGKKNQRDRESMVISCCKLEVNPTLKFDLLC